MDAKVVTAPTEGDWLLEGPDMFGDYNILHRADALAVAAVVSNMRLADEVCANARLIVSACNSYQRHFADPVSAAEGDLLGRCVEALRARIEALRSGTIEDEAQVDERIRTILSQVREVRG